MKPCRHNAKPYYNRLIEPLRERARELGYALGVHGSLKRDIDLIAAPWTEDAEHPFILARELRKVAEVVVGYAEPAMHERSDWHEMGMPGSTKPHGRLCWTFMLKRGLPPGKCPYLDLSVMPRISR